LNKFVLDPMTKAFFGFFCWGIGAIH
jgi:hypothetical protein